MLEKALKKLIAKENLLAEEMENAMEAIMSGEVPEIQIAAFLTALKLKGETVDEIAAAARIMREKAGNVSLADVDVLDTCGTGGDGAGTFNVSTAVAIVAAACGVKVAKHGNRAATSSCGCADVLEELGVNINQPPDKVKSCMEHANLGFMFAPLYHKSMKHVANTRKQLGFRTVFNILGPLCNPAGAKFQILGVFNEELAVTMAKVLKMLKVKHAMVVNGSDGLDEITMTGPTRIVEIRENSLDSYIIKPEDFGFRACGLSDLKGGGRKENAAILRDILSGCKGPKRDMVLLNSGAALYVAGRCKNVAEGIKIAGDAIDSGKALDTLNRFIDISSESASNGENVG